MLGMVPFAEYKGDGGWLLLAAAAPVSIAAAGLMRPPLRAGELTEPLRLAEDMDI